MTENNKKLIDKLKEKFSRIFNSKGSKPRDPRVIDIINQTIENSEKPIKISEISKITKLKPNTISGQIKYLEKGLYVEKTKIFTPPYLMVISKEVEENEDIKPEFIYGKEKRDNRCSIEKKVLLDELKKRQNSKEILRKIKELKKFGEYKGKFFEKYNELVLYLWNKGVDIPNKMRVGSGANRYISTNKK